MDGEPSQPLTRERELALALDIARAYYLDDESKVAIAERFGITRFQVARLIAVARESGMVHIDVRPPGGIDRELSALLQSALGLHEAIVVSSLSGVSPLEDIGSMLAQTVARRVKPGDVLGLSWSRATISMTNQLTHLAHSSVVQLGGHVEAPGLPGTVEIVRRAASISGGEAFPIYAPLVAPDAHTADALQRDPSIATALAMCEHVTLAVVSVGAWSPSASTIYDAVDDSVRQQAFARGVVGEISGRLFDGDGCAIADVIDDRVVGVTLERLSSLPDVIVSSYGAYRADATIAAARAGVIRTLVADRSVAQAILERLAP